MIRDLLEAGLEFGPMILLATAILVPLLAIILGALMALVGFRIMDFYDLRGDIAIKVVLGTVIGGWLLLLVCIAVFGR